MRTREVLVKGFEEVKILMQYLYMNEEHKIKIPNGLTTLCLSMDENMETINYDSYLGFKHKRPMELSEWFSCIELLKEQPSDYEHGQFQNKWEEIKAITLMNVALNAGV